MKVLKFGGTSVGSAQRIKNVASIVCDQEQKIVVLSAMAGTTNSLVEISECFHKKDPEKANAVLSSLEQAYVNHIEELYRSDVYKEKAMQYMLERFQHVWSFSNMPFSVFDEKEILVQGELISTFLMACYLEEQGVEVALLPALNFMRITVDNEPDMEYISKHLKVLLEQNKEAEIYITQGFICRNAYGSIDNLERGGSDYTASLIGAAIQAPVRQLNFDEAAKLAHFGAKILHPACILPAKEKNIPVRLLNALQPSASGTLISNTAEKEAIKAVAAKDNITYVKIKSLHTIPTPHFLSIVFDTFYNYNTPVDMVTTSDIGVSVAIDNDKHIDEIVGVLREYATITVEKNMVIVCVVGDLEWQNVGFEARIINALKDIPVRMISYGGSSSNVSLVMKAEDKVHALKALSEHLFSVSDIY